MCVKEIHEKSSQLFEKVDAFALLLVRLILAYTFFFPAMAKFSNIEATAGFFDYLGIPLPMLNAYMVAGFEFIGAIFLLLGLFTRLFSIPLLGIMAVAILTVHGANGFHVITPDVEWTDPYINGEAIKGTVVMLQNGYEMVLYYIAMLSVLVSKGAGCLSLDKLLFKQA